METVAVVMMPTYADRMSTFNAFVICLNVKGAMDGPMSVFTIIRGYRVGDTVGSEI